MIEEPCCAHNCATFDQHIRQAEYDRVIAQCRAADQKADQILSIQDIPWSESVQIRRRAIEELASELD